MNKLKRNEKLIKAVGLRLRQLREMRELSQEKVLFQTDIHLSRIENGHKNITFGTLVELCSSDENGVLSIDYTPDIRRERIFKHFP